MELVLRTVPSALEYRNVCSCYDFSYLLFLTGSKSLSFAWMASTHLEEAQQRASGNIKFYVRMACSCCQNQGTVISQKMGLFPSRSACHEICDKKYISDLLLWICQHFYFPYMCLPSFFFLKKCGEIHTLVVCTAILEATYTKNQLKKKELWTIL